MGAADFNLSEAEPLNQLRKAMADVNSELARRDGAAHFNL
jgi:hypothetical protein